MTTASVAHHAVTATLFAGYLAAIGRHPNRWHWPDSTGDYLRYRIDTLAVDLLLDGANVAVAA